jgi:4-hydroxy-tetrahydrodipicolinate synthase
MKLTGLLAALVTPVDPDHGGVDLDTLDQVCEFVLERGVDGVCLGGATAEYPRFELTERLAIIERVSRRVRREAAVVTAIGSSSVARVMALGRAAADAGSRAVLLPMPIFFRYEQIDLAAYCAHVAGEVDLPCLLYDLPEFANPLQTETALHLLERERNIVGIKDSSGRRENLRGFLEARGTRDWTLFIGDDRNAAHAFEAGWDGGISGIACCCPELLVALHRSASGGDVEEGRRCQGLLDELIAKLSVLPTPWGVRVALGARGIDTGPLPLPLSAERLEQIAHIEEWLPRWLETAGIPNLQPVR